MADPAGELGRSRPWRRAWGIASVTAITETATRGRIASTAFDLALPLALTIALWRGLYSGQSVVAGVTHDQAVTYAVLAALLTYLRVGIRLRARDAVVQHVRAGTILYWFLRPLPPAAYHLLRAAGDLGFALAWVFPTYLVCLVTGAVSPPTDTAAAGAGLLSFGLGQVIAYLITALLDLSSFWTIVNEQLVRMVGLVQTLLSGGFAPLWFFPGWFQATSRALPFQGIVNVPMGIYLGRTRGGSLLLDLGSQVLWCLLLAGAARLVWRRAALRVDAVGG